MEDDMMRLCYTGSSMNPLLRVPDVIGLVPYCSRGICVGDVAVFTDPARAGSIVHRVVSVRSGLVTTRGDNSTQDDPDINVEQVVGRVVCAWRGGRCRKIHGGLAGQLWAIGVAMPYRTLCRLDRAVTSLLRPIYLRCAKAGVVNRVFSLQSKLRTIQIERPDGSEIQLYLGKSRIGRLPPHSTRWDIRRPYRLFIAEDKLPTPSKKPLARADRKTNARADSCQITRTS